VGWPAMAVAVILVPFYPFWSLALFLSAYAVMFSGHFLFERNMPTVLKHPVTPFVIAGSVIRAISGRFARLMMPRSAQNNHRRSERTPGTAGSQTTEPN
jgi:hypothetical protein